VKALRGDEFAQHLLQMFENSSEVTFNRTYDESCIGEVLVEPSKVRRISHLLLVPVPEQYLCLNGTEFDLPSTNPRHVVPRLLL
jgi:hypothetical protein